MNVSFYGIWLIFGKLEPSWTPQNWVKCHFSNPRFAFQDPLAGALQRKKNHRLASFLYQSSWTPINYSKSNFTNPHQFSLQDPLAGALQRKKSLPDVQCLDVTTKAQGSKAMTREEISVLSSARREAVRRQLEEIESYRNNPFLYILNPRITVIKMRRAVWNCDTVIL